VQHEVCTTEMRVDIYGFVAYAAAYYPCNHPGRCVWRTVELIEWVASMYSVQHNFKDGSQLANMCKQEQGIEGSLFLDFCHTTQMVQTINVQHFKSCAPKSRTNVTLKSLMASFCCMTLLILIVTHRMQHLLNVMQWKALQHHACSQELLPCNFHIFGWLQIYLIGHTLTFDGHAQEATGLV
jgi:hypothetical protein